MLITSPHRHPQYDKMEKCPDQLETRPMRKKAAAYLSDVPDGTITTGHSRPFAA
jgi:hypothetical protein